LTPSTQYNLTKKKFHIADLVEFFPGLEMPVTLSNDSAWKISENNRPIPAVLIEEYILGWEDEEPDEMTEFVPCFKIEGTTEFTALVYWKAGLLKYEYIIVTLDKRGQLISRKQIAGTSVDGDLIKSYVAHIDEDLTIHIVAGANKEGEHFSSAKSQEFHMDILPGGEVVFAHD
jgi:hypothetical protein